MEEEVQLQEDITLLDELRQYLDMMEEQQQELITNLRHINVIPNDDDDDAEEGEAHDNSINNIHSNIHSNPQAEPQSQEPLPAIIPLFEPESESLDPDQDPDDNHETPNKVQSPPPADSDVDPDNTTSPITTNDSNINNNNNTKPPKPPPTMIIYTLPDLTNDENAPIKLSSYNSHFDNGNQMQTSEIYCGRFFGTDIIPHSDGRCGPDDGPSCPSCIKLRQEEYKSKRDILKRLFPGLYVLFADKCGGVKGDMQDVLLGQIAKDDDGNKIVDLEKYCGYNNDNSGGGDDSYDHDEGTHPLDTYLIQILRQRRGHFGRSILDIKTQYHKLQMECNLSFKFPEKASNNKEENDDNDDHNSSTEVDMIQNIDPEIALSKPIPRPSKTSYLNNNIQTICEVTNMEPLLVEYLYREMSYDIDETIEHIMVEGLNGYDPADPNNDIEEVDEEEQVAKYMALIDDMNGDDENKKENTTKLIKKRNEHISYAVEHAKEMMTNDIVVGKMKELKESLNTAMKFEPLSDGEKEEGEKPSMISIRGHCMIRASKENPFHCRICTSQVPSREGGCYYSEQCNLCEGCIQTPYSSIRVKEDHPDDEDEEDIDRGEYDYLHCPMNLNGGHLHFLPLKPAFDKRTHCICDICEHHGKSEESHEIVWYNEEHDFDVCIDCIHRPPPKNYCRKKNEIVHPFQKDEETFAMHAVMNLFGNDVDDELDDGYDIDGKDNEEPQLLIAHNFDNTAIESKVAAHWDVRKADKKLDEKMILGSGTIGNNNPEDESTSTSSTSTPDNIQTSIPTNLGNDGNLPDEAMNALYILEQPSLDVGLRAAADIAQAEDILRRVAPTVQANENSSYNALLDCISAGKLGLAGSLLVSNNYSPMCIQCNDDSENSDEKQDNNEELTCCCCFEVINKETAPDGVVGCLSGHCMHAACASDLLLGGGKCPTCRQTLFYSKVAGSEIKAAAKFTTDEIDRIRMEEEEKVKKELSELAREGLPIKFTVGDMVCIPADREYCKQLQCNDPSSGGWHDDMISGCGLEGSVTDIITNSKNNAVSVRVKSSGQHKFEVIRRIDDFQCKECGSNPIGLRHCIHCNECEMCCRRKVNECSSQSHEWYWNPSILTLLRRCNGSSPLALTTNSEACKAEKHILRLKGELVAIKAAREAVKENMTELMASQVNLEMPGGIGRQLSQKSTEAITIMVDSGISPSDRQRAEHLLTLANQWGDSDSAKSIQAQLHEAVKEGQLDSVARIVRRYNAEQTAEAARWAEASRTTNDYIVESWAMADLRVFPFSNSPRTGVNLKPNTAFSSAEEVLDKEGHMWVKIDPQSVEREKDDAPLPQGWIKIRPGGDGYAPIVRKKTPSLQCFCCGDSLVPPTPLNEKYEIAQKDKVKEGDTLLVSSTLERVKVKSINEKYIECSYFIEGNDGDHTYGSFLYRPFDLVVPKLGRTGDRIDEDLLVNGRLRNRRELVLSHKGNQDLAQSDWNAAKKKENYFDQEFASCPRGHLLHARCLQQTLINGSRCPAPGCMEQLFLPKIARMRNDDNDTCCGGNNENAEEIEALRAASELAGHSARLEAGSSDGITENNTRELFSDKRLKMCPMCCSGPLLNNECSDMSAHHGQCSMRALKGKDKRPCTENGDYRASPSDIAARMTQVSSTKSVADLLPRCPTHNCLVMFNGCMNCGHLFTDIDWNDLPDWNPKARAYLELDKKRRNAARLLTEQIRSEASLLQFERDAFCEANEDSSLISGGWSGGSMKEKIEPPPSRSKDDKRKEKFKTFYVSPPSVI